MAKIVAYIRVSTDKQDMQTQKLEILDYAQKNKMMVDQFIEVEVSSRKSRKDRRIKALMEQLDQGDVLILSELSRLGRSVTGVIEIVNQLLQNRVRLVVLKQGLDFTQHNMMTKTMVTMFALFAELERDLISDRTKRGMLKARAAGKLIGRPKGTTGGYKLDPYAKEIEQLRLAGVSCAAIARMLQQQGISVHVNTVRRFCDSRP